MNKKIGWKKTGGGEGGEGMRKEENRSGRKRREGEGKGEGDRAVSRSGC